MSIRRKLPHIVCYDIRDPRRLGRVHRYLKRIAVPMQYSVFLLYVNPIDLDRIVGALERLIDLREDDIRIYPLPQNPDWQCWGRSLWPDGVHLEGMTLPEKHNVLN